MLNQVVLVGNFEGTSFMTGAITIRIKEGEVKISCQPKIMEQVEQLINEGSLIKDDLIGIKGAIDPNDPLLIVAHKISVLVSGKGAQD